MKKAKIGINLFILCQEGVEDGGGKESPLITKDWISSHRWLDWARFRQASGRRSFRQSFGN